MDENPYAVLGVLLDAAQDDIRAAYRQLAKDLHPDHHPGNKESEEEFKRVSAAYDLLNTPTKRARYDRSMIDPDGDFDLGADFFGDGFWEEDLDAFYSRSSRGRHLYRAPRFGWRWTCLVDGSYRYCRWTDGRLSTSSKPPPPRSRRRLPKLDLESLRPLIEVALERFGLHDEMTA